MTVFHLVPFALALLAEAAPALQEEASPSAFESVLVEGVPESEEGPRPGDRIEALEGEAPTSLSALRRQVAEGIGKTLRVRIVRRGESREIEWAVKPGSYRLAEWPTPAEAFRRAHVGEEETVGIQAGIDALEAVRKGRARTAFRLISKATGAGVRDPLLNWAEGWVLLRYRSSTNGCKGPIDKAFGQVEKARGVYGRRIRGMCHLARGYRALALGDT